MTALNEHIYALLIGVDFYFPNLSNKAVKYGHLNGCVNDVSAMESYLRTRLGLPDENIFKLTASHNKHKPDQPLESNDLWPTYENVISRLNLLCDMAGEGDQVIIHYAGHGGRVKSIYPKETKSGSIDEAFVPTDFGLETGRYIRDLEFAHLLKKLSDQGVLVTAFLDCCHSGGMTRGDAVPRGIPEIDETEYAAETFAAETIDDLVESWNSLTRGMRGGDPVPSGGIPVGNQSVVIAACRPSEFAYEFRFDGVNKHGALTYWLLKTLQNQGASLTYSNLHQQAMAQVHGDYSNQRPQLYGDGDRLVFGRETILTRFSVPILRVSKDQKGVVLNAGFAQGIQKGAQFAIFPLDAPNLDNFDQVIGYVTVANLTATTATSKVNEVINERTIEPGFQAVLVNPGNVRLRSLVKLIQSGEGALSDATRAALHQTLSENPAAGFIEWATPSDAAHFLVCADQSGNFEIRDSSDTLIPNITPALKIDDLESSNSLIKRLIHLSRYRNVDRLTNSDSRAKDVPRITFKWEDKPISHTFVEQDIAKLYIKNESKHDIEITILELGPDWSIRQVYPEPPTESFTFSPGETDLIEIEVFVAGDDDVEVSTYKCFATLDGTNFRMLQLPSLDEEFRGAEVRGDLNPLEELLSMIVETPPQTRAGKLISSTGRRWNTAQLELRVRKDDRI